MAIFNKIKSNPSLIMDVLKVYQSGELNIFTNIGVMDMLALAPMALNIDMNSVESHVLTGPYKTFMKNFTFNDQEHRQQVIKDVYGLEVPQMQYVSFEYSKWLTDAGLTTAKYLNIAKAVIDHARLTTNPDEKQQAALADLESQYDLLVTLFDATADTMNPSETNTMVKERTAIKDKVDKVAKLFDFKEEYAWGRNTYWYRDTWVNECQYNWN